MAQWKKSTINYQLPNLKSLRATKQNQTAKKEGAYDGWKGQTKAKKANESRKGKWKPEGQTKVGRANETERAKESRKGNWSQIVQTRSGSPKESRKGKGKPKDTRLLSRRLLLEFNKYCLPSRLLARKKYCLYCQPRKNSNGSEFLNFLYGLRTIKHEITQQLLH